VSQETFGFLTTEFGLDEKRKGVDLFARSSLTPRFLLLFCFARLSWRRSELHNLSKQGKKEAQAEKRDRMWKKFKRDEDKLYCGASLRQLLVWGTFALCIV